MSETKSLADRVARFGPHGPGPMMGGPRGRASDRTGTLRRVWRYIGAYRWQMAGVASLVGMTTTCALLNPYLIGRAIDGYVIPGNMRGLVGIIAILLGLCLVSAACTWLQAVAMIRMAQHAVADIRRDLIAKLETLPLRYFDKQPHGELMSRLTNDPDAIAATLGDSVTQLIGSVLGVLGAGTIMFSLNWRLAIASLVTIPGVFLAMRWIAKHTRQGFRERQQAMGELNGMIEEFVTGQRVIHVCNRQAQTIAAFDEANNKLRKTGTRAVIIVGLMGPVMGVFRNSGFALLAAAGGWMVTRDLATIGLVAAFLTYSQQFTRPLHQIAALYGSVQGALAGAERVFAVLDESPEPADASDAIALSRPSGHVEFANVHFSYTPGVPVLRGVSYEAMPGQTIALVGPTGAGKTTIINLLTRFYDIDSGSIRIDGHDLRALRRDTLRRSLGIVLQDTFLFAGSVRENIRYGRPEATEDEVIAAAKLANADGFIRHLPHGYDTVLGESAASLSQGQRQLLAIARAIVSDPAILVLDEATSSVDTRTELHIQQAMLRLMNGRTSFVIAHRLSTIRKADCILVISDGEVAERGTHEQLLTARGMYWRLCMSQYGEAAMAG